jgi:aspartyl protease family protein
VSNGDDALHFIYLIGLIVIVGSSLAVRRLPMGQGLKMAAGWILIFVVFFVGFTLKDDFASLYRRVVGGSGEGQVVHVGDALRIRKSEDGHFWVDGDVDGTKVRFLIDSGASKVSLTAETARKAGVEPSSSFPVMIATANGTVPAQTGTAKRIKIGTIERRDMDIYMAETFGDMNVLGMNFLSSLSSWGVEGEWLVLKP